MRTRFCLIIIGKRCCYKSDSADVDGCCHCRRWSVLPGTKIQENNNTATPTCSAENIRVWNITPINTFLLAFEGGMLNAGTYEATPNSFTCAADVVGATVNPLVPDATLVYGNNTLNYVATASGILGNWRPDIQVPALQTSQVLCLSTVDC